MRDPDTAYARTPLDTRALVATNDRRRVLIDTAGAVVQRDLEVFEGRPISPGVPLIPWLPRGEDPREFYIQAGYNLNYVPRAEFPMLTPFPLLRNLAAASDLVQIARQEVIDSILALEWDVVPEDPKEARAKGMRPECDYVKAFLEYPDRIHPFDGWLHALLLDALDIDALTFYRRRTLSGDPHSLLPIDGATIKPILDWHGVPPEPPEVAYQQIIAGVPETEFSRPYLPLMERDTEEHPTELVYLPFSPRTIGGYGQSPLERVLITVNLALRRQLHHLAYFTDGNIPDAFWKCPDTWNAEQVIGFQEKLEKILSGESGMRRKLRMMPGGEGTGLELPRGSEMEPSDLNEFMARVVAMAYHISPQPLVKMMNRATSEEAGQAAADTGLSTWQHKVRKMISREAREFLGVQGIKFIFVEERHRDEVAWTNKAVAFVKEGIYTRNHVLNEEGLDPIPGGDVPMFDTMNGPVPITSGLMTAGPAAPAAGGAVGQAKAILDGAPPPPVLGGEKGAGEASRILAAVPDIPAAKAASEELRRWRKVALKSLEKAVQFRTDVLGHEVQDAVRLSLQDCRHFVENGERVAWTFRALAKKRKPLVALRTRLDHEQAVRKVVAQHFKDRTPAISRVVVAAFRKMKKADDSLDGFDEAVQPDVLLEELREPLGATFQDGARLASDENGIAVQFNLVDPAAVAYADQRAADLVGMRRMPDGSYVPSPAPGMSITKTLRNDLNALVTTALDSGMTERELRDLIEQETGWTYRSDRVARTEVAIALNNGAAWTYAEGGVQTVTIMDGPGCLEDGHDDDEEGVDGEIWSVDKWLEFPIGHPYCVRDARPNVPGEMAA